MEQDAIVNARVADELVELEPIFHRLPAGSDRAAIEAIIEPTFFEVGASGSVYRRDFVLRVVEQRYLDGTDPNDDAWKIADFDAADVSDDLVLVTYHLVFDGRPSRRSTLWRRHEEGWRAIYHQGTAQSA